MCEPVELQSMIDCSSIRDCFGNSVFTVQCFSKVLEALVAVLFHVAFPVTGGHLSRPE